MAKKNEANDTREKRERGETNETSRKPYFDRGLKRANSALKKCPATAEEWLRIWNKFIRDIFNENAGSLGIFDRAVLRRAKYDFDGACEFARRIPSPRDRKAFFIILKTDYEQFLVSKKFDPDPVWGDTFHLSDSGFGEKCKIEIEKLDALEKIPVEPAEILIDGVHLQNLVGQDEYDPTKRGLTRQLAMMLIDDLFPNLRNASNTAKAELLALLTGWSEEGLRNKWSDYTLGNRQSIAKDKAKVTEWKQKLKIT